MMDAAAPRAISVVAAQRENQAHKIGDVGRRPIGEGLRQITNYKTTEAGTISNTDGCVFKGT
jgi:hypothetical protein